MALRSKQVPCEVCIQAASKAYGDAEARPPGLCFACKATLAKLRMPREKGYAHARSTQSLLAEISSERGQTSDSSQSAAGSSATSSRTRSDDTQATTSESIATLDLLTRQFVGVVNERDFANNIWHKAADSIEVGALDNFHPTTTLEENIETFRTITRETPQYCLHVMGIDIIEDQDGETVESYINMRVTGRPEGLVMNSIARMQWTRYHDDWVLTSFTAMRFSDPS